MRFDLGYLNALAVQERSRASLGREHFIARGIGDHAGDQFARVLQSQRHVVDRKIRARNSWFRPADPRTSGNSDDPFVSPALLGDDRMRGKVRAEPLDDQLFAGAVGLGDQIVLRLELEPDVLLPRSRAPEPTPRGQSRPLFPGTKPNRSTGQLSS